jgi:hypothetical protein
MFKKLLALSLCGVLFQSPIFAQNDLNNLPKVEVSEKGLSEATKKTYRNAAYTIAVRLMRENQPTKNQSIEIPQNLVDFVYATLTQAQAQHPKLVADLIQKYQISARQTPSVEGLIILVDPKEGTDKAILAKLEQDVQSIYKGSKMTKLAYLDAERSGLILQFDKPINTAPIAHKLFLAHSYGTIEPTLPTADGSDILLKETPNGWELTYKLGFGKNCAESKCSKIHEWQFLMDNKAQISFKGEKGDAIPANFKP